MLKYREGKGSSQLIKNVQNKIERTPYAVAERGNGE